MNSSLLTSLDSACGVRYKRALLVGRTVEHEAKTSYLNVGRSDLAYWWLLVGFSLSHRLCQEYSATEDGYDRGGLGQPAGPFSRHETLSAGSCETYQPGSSDYATLRYQLHAPDRPDWASFRVLHPANDAMGFASLPTPNRVFVGNDMAVFVALSPENKLEKALTYPIVKEPPQTLAALEYYFDKLVGNYRPPSNAPLPLVPPPPPPLPLDDPTQS